MFKNLYTTHMSGDGKLLQRRFTAIRQGGSFSRLMTAAAITAMLIVIIVAATFAAALNDVEDYDGSLGPVEPEYTVSGVNITDSGDGNDNIDPWGITLAATNVTDTGLTIICEQSGGEHTGELQTGPGYSLERCNDNGTWAVVETQNPGDLVVYNGGIVFSIAKNNKTTWMIDWESLYGQLPSGTYRIGKWIYNYTNDGNYGPKNFYGGDYDNKIYYAEFDINETTDNKRAERVHPVRSNMKAAIPKADTKEPVVDPEQNEEAEDTPATIGEMRKQFINEYLIQSDLSEIPMSDWKIEEAPANEAERNDRAEDVPDDVDEMRKQFIVDHLLR